MAKLGSIAREGGGGLVGSYSGVNKNFLEGREEYI